MSSPPPLTPPPPRFSKRRYFGQPYGPAELLAKLSEGEPLIIYVEHYRSEYPEDWRVEEGAWRNQRAFMSRCYSVVEPEGEVGFTPLDQVEPITEEEFRGALAALKTQNWPRRRDS